MNEKLVSLFGLLITASMLGMLFTMSQISQFAPVRSGATLIDKLDMLPPSGAGGQPPRPNVYMGGTHASGRVTDIYVKVAENVFLSLDKAPQHLAETAERWVDVEFPELLANDAAAARAILNRSEAGVEVGDVVEIRFAHKDNKRFFPVKETTRVTELVAKEGSVVARNFERRIHARNGHNPAGLDWLLNPADAASTSSRLPLSTTADAGR